ncbi:Splicing factor U2af small subunit A [Vitis vinifera]|uniref:Splicing factor U2af small subunit A n=1 Tax=Vitis vinifera TaxID=29760 RepID=A0A438JSP6_VITVI|nr:Splicing factor U2af small subunit A [Vitis vinifera]
MAEHLASIFGTEKDRVNCPFYFKIGACRHGDRCSRLHTKPSISPTLLLSNMYQRPDMVTPGVDPQGQPLDPRKIQEHFEVDFYEDLFEELSKYGEIESLNICDNLADHMVGNVYVQFREEEHAANALRNLNGRFYAGRPIIVDFSPVTDFREATCRQYEENICNRGGYCNFMHLKKISRQLRRQLFGRNRRRRSRSRSRSPYRHRGHEEHPHVLMVLMVHMVHMVHVVHVALIEEMMTEIIVTMIGGVGGLEAEVLHVEGDEAEALVEEGIRVQSGKAVLREGLRLSNGIGKENRQKLLIRMIIATVTMVTTTMTLNKMINSIIIHSIRRRTSSSSSSMEDTTIDPIELFGSGIPASQDRASIFMAAYHDICIQAWGAVGIPEFEPDACNKFVQSLNSKK